MKQLGRGEFLQALVATGAGVIGFGGCGDAEEDKTPSDAGAAGKGGSANGGASGSGSGKGGQSGAGAGGSAGSGGTAGSASGGSAGSSGAGAGGAGAGGAGAGRGGTAGSAGSSTGDAGLDCSQQINAQITCRHGHALLVTAADITAGVAKTYDIQGTNTLHGHMVRVTAQMFTQLKSGQTVQIAVASSSQPHTIYLSCARPDPGARDLENCN